jgi:hypothetical protein
MLVSIIIIARQSMGENNLYIRGLDGRDSAFPFGLSSGQALEDQYYLQKASLSLPFVKADICFLTLQLHKHFWLLY